MKSVSARKDIVWPKITVVTPNFNHVDYLEDTILSVISQNYPSLEYIIIDGGSTDGSIDIIKKYERKLSYWLSEPDQGVYDAVNKGFAKSSGAILMWLNSDDLLHPGALFNVGEIFYSFPEVRWITGINTSYDETGRVIGADRARGFSRFDFCTYRYQWLQQESTAWRRDLWEQAGGALDTRYKLAADFELWLRFFRYTSLYPCDVLIGGFRMRSKNQLSADFISVYHEEAEQAIKNERKMMKGNERALVFCLEFIAFIKKVLRYTYVLDWKIFDRGLNKLSRIIRKPSYRLQVNRATCRFEIVKGLNA